MGRFPTVGSLCRNFTKILRLLPTPYIYIYIYTSTFILMDHLSNFPVSAGQGIPLLLIQMFLSRVKK